MPKRLSTRLIITQNNVLFAKLSIATLGICIKYWYAECRILIFLWFVTQCLVSHCCWHSKFRYAVTFLLLCQVPSCSMSYRNFNVALSVFILFAILLSVAAPQWQLPIVISGWNFRFGTQPVRSVSGQ